MSAPLLLGEDRLHLYLFKPAGVPVFPPHQDPDGDSLLRRLLELDPARAAGWPAGFAGGLAHRLDTGTSGLVIAARTLADLGRLRGEFSAGALRKFYRLRSLGTGGLGLGQSVLIERPLAHHARREDRMVVARPTGHPGRHRGKWYPAWTRFERRDDDGGPCFDAEIRTGVTHQIRAHAAALGLPVRGDPIYGTSEREAAVLDDDPAPSPSAPPSVERLWLHHLRIVGPAWTSPIAPPWG